jgi:hypothetical protein
MATGELPVVLEIQADAAGELFAVDRTDDLVVPGGEEPGALWIEAMGDAQRLDGEEPIRQPLVVEPVVSKVAADAGGVHGAGGEYAVNIGPGKGEQDGVEDIVDGSGERRDESAEAGALKADGAADQGEGSDDIARAADIRGGLAKVGEKFVPVERFAGGFAQTVLGHVHDEGVDAVFGERLGDVSGYEVAALENIEDEHRRADRGMTGGHAGDVPVEVNLIPDRIPPRQRGGEADGEIADDGEFSLCAGVMAGSLELLGGPDDMAEDFPGVAFDGGNRANRVGDLDYLSIPCRKRVLA